jgi:hypothetical protein
LSGEVVSSEWLYQLDGQNFKHMDHQYEQLFLCRSGIISIEKAPHLHKMSGVQGERVAAYSVNEWLEPMESRTIEVRLSGLHFDIPPAVRLDQGGDTLITEETCFCPDQGLFL